MSEDELRAIEARAFGKSRMDDTKALVAEVRRLQGAERQAQGWRRQAEDERDAARSQLAALESLFADPRTREFVEVHKGDVDSMGAALGWLSPKVCAEMDTRLAAAQAEARGLREALRGSGAHLLRGYARPCDWRCSHAVCAAQRTISAALATPSDESALREAVAKALEALTFGIEVEQDVPRGYNPTRWLTLNGKRVTERHVEDPEELIPELHAAIRALAKGAT